MVVRVATWFIVISLTLTYSKYISNSIIFKSICEVMGESASEEKSIELTKKVKFIDLTQ